MDISYLVIAFAVVVVLKHLPSLWKLAQKYFGAKHDDTPKDR